MEDKLEQLEKRLERLESLIGTKLSQEQARKYIGGQSPYHAEIRAERYPASAKGRQPTLL